MILHRGKRKRMRVYLELVVDILRNIFRWLMGLCFSASASPNIGILSFDDGILARIDRKISEGGFSYVYSATDVSSSSSLSRGIRRQYAVKRIICADEELVRGCKREARIHQAVGNLETNTLPLLGLKFDSSQPQTTCYMLFPLISGGSLRDEITKRNILNEGNYSTQNKHKGNPCPFTEYEILHLFLGILRGTKAIHDMEYAHCDIKLENVLLNEKQQQSSSSSTFVDEETGRSSDIGNALVQKPILIDYGSVRILTVRPIDRRTVMNMVEEAASNSTISYRAPELFDGGCRYGPDEPAIDGRSDVWSCGCVLFAMMYGTSPFEMEFRKDGTIRIVDCTYLRILGGSIPIPPPNTEIGKLYSEELLNIVKWILQEDRVKRPHLGEVIDKIQFIIKNVIKR